MGDGFCFQTQLLAINTIKSGETYSEFNNNLYCNGNKMKLCIVFLDSIVNQDKQGAVTLSSDSTESRKKILSE